MLKISAMLKANCLNCTLFTKRNAYQFLVERDIAVNFSLTKKWKSG